MPDYPFKRCFLALPLDEVAIADLTDAMSGVAIDGLRLTRPENLHVTLKFLGDVDDPDLPRLIELLQRIAVECRPFELNMTGIDYLPDARRARVLAAKLDRPAALAALFDCIEEASFDLGFPREGRAYHPHITLGRFRRPPRMAPAPDTFRFTPTTLPVASFTLLESTLGGSAPTYTPLGEFPFVARP